MSYEEVNMYWHWSFLNGIKGFYEGCDVENMSFKFGGIVWNIIKDDLDGERSLIDFVVYGNQDSLFENNTKAKVKLEEIEESPLSEYEIFSGWTLKGVEDNHIWLIVGTDYSSDLFPKVIFKHFAKNK